MSHRFLRTILLSARSGNILLGVAVIIIVIVIIIAPIGIAVPVGRRHLTEAEVNKLITIVDGALEKSIIQTIIANLQRRTLLFEVHINDPVRHRPLDMVGHLIIAPRRVLVIVYPIPRSRRIGIWILQEADLRGYDLIVLVLVFFSNSILPCHVPSSVAAISLSSSQETSVVAVSARSSIENIDINFFIVFSIFCYRCRKVNAFLANHNGKSDICERDFPTV